MTVTSAIHPGEHLAEILEELGISQYRLAKAIGVPPIRINEIVHFQRMYDLDLARASIDTSAIEPLVEESSVS